MLKIDKLGFMIFKDKSPVLSTISIFVVTSKNQTIKPSTDPSWINNFHI